MFDVLDDRLLALLEPLRHRRPSRGTFVARVQHGRASRRCSPARASRRSSSRSCCSRATSTRPARRSRWRCRSSSASAWRFRGRSPAPASRRCRSRARGWSASSRRSASFILGDRRLLRLRGVLDSSRTAGSTPTAVASSVEEQLKAGWHASLAEGLAAAQREQQAGAHRHVGDLVQELPDDGQDDAAERGGAVGARRLREDQVPGGRSRRAAGQERDAAVRRRRPADLRHPAPTVERRALRRDLEQRPHEDEVRFDRVSRALYSTDASVYQIEPLGVVVPRTREDVVRDRRDRARGTACRSPRAAAARRRPARRSAPGCSSTPRSTSTASSR